MRDLICDVINLCASRFDIGKISVYESMNVRIFYFRQTDKQTNKQTYKRTDDKMICYDKSQLKT